LKKLARAGCQKKILAAEPGDVLIMFGGVVVHASPEVVDEPRIATYAHWVAGGSD
jgi:hypothetical protein